MKKILFVLALAGCAALAAAGDEAVRNFYAGRPQTLPFRIAGPWKLVAGHGRMLASGVADGRTELTITVPDLNPGAAVAAELICGDRVEKVKFHAPDLLAGRKASAAVSAARHALLRQAGLEIDDEAATAFLADGETSEAATQFIFCRAAELPLEIPADYRELSVVKTALGGSLGVALGERKELAADGDATYVKIVTPKKTIFVFSPDFDLAQIDSILLIQKLMGEGRK
jgi:hypothetical protein